MKISSRFTVAVHILALLSIENEAHCTSDWIAGSVNTNPVVVRRVIGQLKRAGFVQVRQGTGGAFLAKDIKEITLLDIYRAVDVVEEGELFQMHEHPNPQCPVGANIQAVLEVILRRAQAAMEHVLKEIPLYDVVHLLAEKIESSRS
ncbi:BadM/Rrf2 family transcriptional regulator [Anoxybacillus flavithermus NBRC 109594]|uniref:BadM/Rrf2 family transcriptional regulator n=1 Tax=Anoxybacillus flavithermus NBRC 109594 TaxID=1315967 RepID=R4G1E4_9BACL|nr:Rrf2 family transcriptional regulator [Anoxybacillus flavithermus]GAC91479.1 BadM/Rrf2 family transcriptional regulator [Anoxybacillus flavithermus NBRC 109594]